MSVTESLYVVKLFPKRSSFDVILNLLTERTRKLAYQFELEVVLLEHFSFVGFLNKCAMRNWRQCEKVLMPANFRNGYLSIWIISIKNFQNYCNLRNLSFCMLIGSITRCLLITFWQLISHYDSTHKER